MQAATAPNRGERIAYRGLQSVTPQEGLSILERVLGDTPPAVGVMRLDLRQWRQFYPKAASLPLLSEIAREQGATPRGKERGGSVARTLSALDTGERRREALEAHVREQLAVVLRLAPSRIDARTPLQSLGFDSLMVVELRNRLEMNLGIMLSAATVFSYPTIATLAPHLAEKMGLTLDTAVAPPAAPSAAVNDDLEDMAEGLLSELEQLS